MTQKKKNPKHRAVQNTQPAPNRNRQNTPPAQRNKAAEPSYLTIVAVMVVLLAVGITAKVILQMPHSSNTGVPQPSATFTNVPLDSSYTASPEVDRSPRPSVTAASLEDRIRQVASNFRCACGGCGELPLVECTCDMPRGAVEEKRFIRRKLEEGLPVERVVQLVEQTYGLRNS
jgi:hypothetical protein